MKTWDGFRVAMDIFAKSMDGGESWSELTSGITDHLISIFFINSSAGWIGGYYNDTGIIIKTSE